MNLSLSGPMINSFTGISFSLFIITSSSFSAGFNMLNLRLLKTFLNHYRLNLKKKPNPSLLSGLNVNVIGAQWLPLGPDFVDAPRVNTEPHWMMVSLGDIPPTITITGVCCWLCMAV